MIISNRSLDYRDDLKLFKSTDGNTHVQRKQNLDAIFVRRHKRGRNGEYFKPVE